LHQAEFRLTCEGVIFVIGILFQRTGRRQYLRVAAVDVGSNHSRNDARGNHLACEAVAELAAAADLDINPRVI
jgi:hypothetical protein